MSDRPRVWISRPLFDDIIDASNATSKRGFGPHTGQPRTIRNS
jgi:hypothetical protein